MPDLRRKRTPSERLAELRAREAIEAKLAEDLPRGHCSVCGGIVPAGTGTLADPNPWSTVAAVWARLDVERVSLGREPIFGWRRRHDHCQGAAHIVFSLTGIQTDEDIAAEALGRLRDGVTAHETFRSEAAAHRALTNNYRPWQHVDDLVPTLLRRAVEAVRAKAEPRRCSEGACAWCGVSTSIGWRSSPESWADGLPAPLCRDCAAVWDLRGGPTDHDALRGCALEALSGASSFGSTGLGIRTFCDLAGEDHTGTAEPWSYAPDALAALTERARMTWPGSLPGDLRDEYVRKAATERAAAYAAAKAEIDRDEAEAEAEALAAEGWPLSV